MRRETLFHISSLALAVALLPPIWGLVSPALGITVAPVALICAGVYASAGNSARNIVPMTLGFWVGDLWSLAALWGFENLPLPPNAALFVTLFVLGGAAVIVGTALRVHVPAMLTGWAMGLTVMGGGGLSGAGALPLELAAAMAVGVLYAGWGVDALTRALVGLWRRVILAGKETNSK